jgi:hypothetical protein
MAYIRKSHLAPKIERGRVDELLAQARAGGSEARRELVEVYQIRVYVQGDALVDAMNQKPDKKEK